MTIEKAETGTMVLRPDSGLNGCGRRVGLYRHQSGEGALLDGCDQRIAGALPSCRDPYRRFRQKTDAGPTEFPLGVDRRGNHHSSHVCSGHCHVCGIKR